MPGAQKRLGEINALMAAESFWNNREQAQKLIDEANSLRNKTEPLLKAEKQLEDFHVMVELGEAEPEAAQAKIQQELEQDLSRFFKELDSLELKVFLSGRHDKSNCIISINAGAGGTESLRLGEHALCACTSAGPRRAAGRWRSPTCCRAKPPASRARRWS